MALKRPPSAIEFMFRIKVQHYSGNFTPVSTLHVRVEQAQIRDEVLLVVHSQHEIGGRGIGDVWIKRPLLHGRSRNRLLIDQLCFGLWHIDDREAVAPHSHRSLPDLRAQMPGPLYLDKPTLSARPVRSEKCQLRTFPWSHRWGLGLDDQRTSARPLPLPRSSRRP